MTVTILIIDDSATARALFKVCFINKPDYQIIEASRWEDAIAKAHQYQPFLIVLDYNMPEKSGSDIALMMQEQGIKANYVLISANTQQSVIDEVQSLGFCEIIEKPVSAARIEALLERLL